MTAPCIYNNSGDTIKEWGLRINITGDCFINQAWNGLVEIHQYVGTDREAVQKFNLQDYALEDVKLEYRHDRDLLIPLQRGDYVVYFPNEVFLEMPLDNGDSVKIGMIFYYVDDLDLSDYDLTIHFHRNFTQGWSFIAFIVLAALWIISSAMYATGIYLFRNERKQMELRRSGLAGMSELYVAIYVINLPTGEITPVSESEYLEGLRTKYASARELLSNAVQGDAADAQLNTVLAFADTDTLAERLKDRDSIVCEFISKQYGWCSFRFIAMDREEGKLPENVIFTVQDINEERTEMQIIADRLEKAESVSTANTAFLTAVSRDLQAPIREVLALDGRILEKTDSETIRKHAEDIRGTAERMLLLISGMADRARTETEKGSPQAERYSLKQLISESFSTVQPAADKRLIRLESDIADTVPDALLGDAPRLKEVIVSLLSDAVARFGDGIVRLSVFGKAEPGHIHLLFSVRSVPEKDVPSTALPDLKPDPEDPVLDMEIAGNLLTWMGSALKTVRSSDAWQDVYFEIDQQAAEDKQ